MDSDNDLSDVLVDIDTQDNGTVAATVQCDSSGDFSYTLPGLPYDGGPGSGLRRHDRYHLRGRHYLPNGGQHSQDTYRNSVAAVDAVFAESTQSADFTGDAAESVNILAQAQADAATILTEAESGTYLSDSDLPTPATAPQISYLGRIDAVRPDDYNAQWQFGEPTEAASASVGVYDPWYWYGYGDAYAYGYANYYGGYGEYNYGSSSASSGYFWGDYGWYVPNHSQDDLIRPTDAAGEAGAGSTYAWWYGQKVGGVQVFSGGSAAGDSALDTFATQADWGYSWYYGDYGYQWTNDVLPGVGGVVDTTTISSLSAVSVTAQIYGLGSDSGTLVGFQASSFGLPDYSRRRRQCSRDVRRRHRFQRNVRR